MEKLHPLTERIKKLSVHCTQKELNDCVVEYLSERAYWLKDKVVESNDFEVSPTDIEMTFELQEEKKEEIGRCVKCGNIVQKEGCIACGGLRYDEIKPQPKIEIPEQWQGCDLCDIVKLAKKDNEIIATLSQIVERMEK